MAQFTAPPWGPCAMSSSPSARRRGGWRRRRCPSFSWIPSRKRRAQTGHRSWVTGPFGMQPPVLGASVFVCLVGTPHPSHHVSSFFFCRLFGCACAFVFFVWEGRSDDFRANMIHAEWSGGGVTKSMIRLFTRNQMQHDAQRSCRCFATHSAPQSPAGSIEPLSSSSSMIMKNGTCKLDMNNIYSSSSMILGSIQGFFFSKSSTSGDFGCRKRDDFGSLVPDAHQALLPTGDSAVGGWFVDSAGVRTEHCTGGSRDGETSSCFYSWLD